MDELQHRELNRCLLSQTNVIFALGERTTKLEQTFAEVKNYTESLVGLINTYIYATTKLSEKLDKHLKSHKNETKHDKTNPKGKGK